MKHILEHNGKKYEIGTVIEDSEICFTTIFFYEVEECQGGIYTRTKKLSMCEEGFGCRSFAEILSKRLGDIESGECPIIEDYSPTGKKTKQQTKQQIARDNLWEDTKEFVRLEVRNQVYGAMKNFSKNLQIRIDSDQIREIVREEINNSLNFLEITNEDLEKKAREKLSELQK